MTKLRTNSIPFIILFFGMSSITIGVSFGSNVSISDATAIEIYANTVNLAGIEIDKETLTVSEVKLPQAGFGGRKYPVKRVVSEQAVIEVNAQTKKVVWIWNKQIRKEALLRAQEVDKENKPIESTRQEDEVAAIAKEYCKSLGQAITSDMKFHFIQYDSAEGDWGLAWIRYIEGYPFEEEAVSIGIDDLTGKLSVYKNTLTTRPCNVDIKISEERAMQIARTHIAVVLPKIVMNQLFEVSKTGQPNLCVVYPNYLLTETIEKMTQEQLRAASQNPRLAYSIKFEFRYVGSEAMRIERPPITIWVDAITGEIIGGI